MSDNISLQTLAVVLAAGQVDAFSRLENIRLEQPQNEGVCHA